MKINKKKSQALWFILIIAMFLMNIPIIEASTDKISARSAYIMDSESGKVIYAKNPDLKQCPASTTKLITSMIAIDLLDLDKVVEISHHAANIYPSHKRLRAGDKYTVRALLNLALMSSVNSAAVALAEAAGGTEEAFVALMNQRAESIGAVDTKFINATGLPGSGQYITAKDLTLIMEEALKYPEIKEIIHTKVKEVKAVKGLTMSAVNTNKLLWSKYDVLGGKTGYTNNALNCLAFAVKKDDTTLVAAVLGDSKRSCLWRSAKQLVSKVDRSENSETIIENTINTENVVETKNAVFKKSSHKKHKKVKAIARLKRRRAMKSRIAKKDIRLKTVHLKDISQNNVAYNKD